MTKPNRERREAEGQGAQTGGADTTTTRVQNKASEARVKAQETASQLANATRSKGAQVAGQAGDLGRKAREADADAGHATARRAVAPLVVAAGVAVAVAGWVSRRRRKQPGILRRLTKR